MNILHRLTVALAVSTAPAYAAPEAVGEATMIKTSVTGQAGSIEVKEPIHRDERIRTSKSGLGEFRFKDGTKLAVGAGSVVTVDKFVYDDSGTAKAVTIRATRGAFRWISGKSRSQAYSIVTPAGTIGVRGTKFDLFVGGDGTTATVMLSGQARFCARTGGCVTLRRSCDAVVATPRSGPRSQRANREMLAELGGRAALPFLTGTQQLSAGFGPSTGCGLRMATLTKPNQPDQRTTTRPGVPTVTRPAPEEPNEPHPAPGPAPEPVPEEPHNPPPKPDKPHGHHHKNLIDAIKAHPGLPDKPDFKGGLGYEGHKGLRGYGLGRGHQHGGHD